MFAIDRPIGTGVRTYADLMKMVEAGATRVGSSNSVNILQEATQMAGKR